MLQYIACCKMSIYDITNCQSAQIKNCYWKKNKEITKWLTSMGMWLLPVGNSALHTIWIMHVISYFCDFLHVQEHMWARACKEWLQRGQWFFMWEEPSDLPYGHSTALYDLQRGQWFFMWEEPSDFHTDILSLKLMKVHMSTTDLSAGKNLCFIWVMKFYGKFLYEALDYSISSFILVSYFDESGSFVLPGFMFLWLSQPF